MTPTDHPAARAYRARHGHDHPHVRQRTAADPRLVFPVRLAIGSRVYDLGTVAGSDPAEISEELADRCEELAKLLRGPEHSAAPPCEGCDAPMVFRRGHPGRYVPMGRKEDGSPFVYGVHNVALCVMDRPLRESQGKR